MGRQRRSLLSPGDSKRTADRRSERSGEAGYTAIELLVSASLLVIVLGAILVLAETTQRIAPKESERALVIREAQVGLHRMTRELRHAYQAPTVTGSTMEASVLLSSGGTKTVRYDCDEAHPTDSAYTRCVRSELSGGTWLGGEVVVDRVLRGGGPCSPWRRPRSPLAAISRMATSTASCSRTAST
jgi:type II secretory pathway pseudopilin PulG